MSVYGFTPLQLVISKSMVFPGMTTGSFATDSAYDDVNVCQIMEQHFEIIMKLREVEFSKKKDTHG